MHLYDLIIIGAGPAGITAAIYAARKRLDLLVITKNIGGQTLLSPDVENYLGYHYLSGNELVKRFEEHMRDYKIEVIKEGVRNIEKSGGVVKVTTDKNSYKARTLIIASGKSYKKLDIPGEREFLGKGISYCATCDAPLFAEKDVAIIGGGNSTLSTCLQLIKIANKIYIINIAPDLTGDEIMREKVEQNKNVAIFNNSKLLEIAGDRFVTGITIETDGEKQKLDVQGVFVEIGLVPNVRFAGIIRKNMDDEIMITRNTEMYKENITNIKGVFAAGDVTDVPEKQIIVAAGEGAKAALAVANYLSRKKEKAKKS